MKNYLACCIFMCFATLGQASECTPAGLLADIAQMQELLVKPTTDSVRKFLSTYTDQDELQHHLSLKNTLNDVIANFLANPDKRNLLSKTLAEVTSETLVTGADLQHFSFKPAVGRPVSFVYLKENWTIKN